MTENIEIELSATRELLAGAYKKLSGKKAHASDCATNNAPAIRPSPCDCSYDGDNRSNESLHEAAEPLFKWLKLNGHPHCTIIMDQTHVELLEGQVATKFTPAPCQECGGSGGRFTGDPCHGTEGWQPCARCGNMGNDKVSHE